ncbi:MAG: hypothetical protein KGL39_35255 [Patescibacteria group bacterium]|nr:hypothetical protein [Patescibacteria group bacterium]
MAEEVDTELRYALEYNPCGKGYEEIERVLAKHDGEKDEEDWVWLVQFKDGARGLYMGGCDYTGWDCQSSLELLPFDGWEGVVREKWYGPNDWHKKRPAADALVTELTDQLEASHES